MDGAVAPSSGIASDPGINSEAEVAPEGTGELSRPSSNVSKKKKTRKHRLENLSPVVDIDEKIKRANLSYQAISKQFRLIVGEEIGKIFIYAELAGRKQPIVLHSPCYGGPSVANGVARLLAAGEAEHQTTLSRHMCDIKNFKEVEIT